MDIKKPSPAWYVKYRTHIAGIVLLLMLIVYTVYLAVLPARQVIKATLVTTATVVKAPFIEYIEVEGVVQPIRTIQLNSIESGFVERIVCEEGEMVKQGDTLLLLSNPELQQAIEQERETWEKTVRNLREQEIQMEQKSIELRLQALEQEHLIGDLERRLTQSRAEFSMGVKSRAELDIVEADYKHQHRKLQLQMQNLRHDSLTTSLRREMIVADREAARRRLLATQGRTDRLVVRSPADGQLGQLNLVIGQQVAANSKIGELNITNSYKVHSLLNEFYVERIHAGLPATIVQKGDTFPLRISRVVPEVKERRFDIDLQFTGTAPDNIRLGKNYRVMIELGQPEPAIVIPDGDFYTENGGRWVYRFDKDTNTARRVKIKLGRRNPEHFEVLHGLNAGDSVITSGYKHIGNVEEVKIQ